MEADKIYIQISGLNYCIHYDNSVIGRFLKLEYRDFISEQCTDDGIGMDIFIRPLEGSINIGAHNVVIKCHNGVILFDDTDLSTSLCLYKDIESMEVFRLAVIKSIILYQLAQENVAIHGACIQLGGKGVILFGNSGVGKSALSGGLVYKYGAKLIADDAFILRNDGKNLFADSISRLTGMDNLAKERLGIEITETEEELSGGIIDRSRNRIHQYIDSKVENSYLKTTKVDMIFCLESGENENSVVPLSKDEISHLLRCEGIPLFSKKIPGESVFLQAEDYVESCGVFHYYVGKNYTWNLQQLAHFIINY